MAEDDTLQWHPVHGEMLIYIQNPKAGKLVSSAPAPKFGPENRLPFFSLLATIQVDHLTHNRTPQRKDFFLTLLLEIEQQTLRVI